MSKERSSAWFSVCPLDKPYCSVGGGAPCGREKHVLCTINFVLIASIHKVEKFGGVLPDLLADCFCFTVVFCRASTAVVRGFFLCLCVSRNQKTLLLIEYSEKQ